MTRGEMTRDDVFRELIWLGWSAGLRGTAYAADLIFDLMKSQPWPIPPIAELAGKHAETLGIRTNTVSRCISVARDNWEIKSAREENAKFEMVMHRKPKYQGTGCREAIVYLYAWFNQVQE